MYSTCLHCHETLGSNDAIEPFPVGRRLAFDAAKGRLWVVCTACGRWNLSPIEERWEAVEECERRFRAQKLHAYRLPRIQRLALEMALHERSEQFALDQELATLERAWREAEEVGAIADDLLVPNAVSERLSKDRTR